MRATAESIGDECASATAECSLRRFAVVVLQEAAQASAADDVGQWYQVGLLLSFPAAWQKQPVVQTLMWSFGMIMLDKFLAEVVHVPLAEYHEVVEAFLLDALHEPLDEGHGIGRAIGRGADVEALFLFQGGVEAGRELGVPIVHNEFGAEFLGARMTDGETPPLAR